jgi:uncharacterized membrane protein (UPF0127 family)
MIHIKPSALLAALLVAASAASAQDGPQRLAAVQLNAGIHNIRAEVALRPDERATGLMHRRTLGANEGMLFVFDEPAVQCFWMKNTLLPLSIAFVGDDGRIVSLADMQPQSLQSHCSARPVRFALEMNQGWFAKRGLREGSRLSGAPFGN